MIFFTGEIPTEALLTDTAIPGIGYVANVALWSTGNIDAPDHFPAGSTRGVKLAEDDFMDVSRYVMRPH